VLAYISWHRPALGVDRAAYEQALKRFHGSLAHRPPSGFAGSVAFRMAEPPWLWAVTDPCEDGPGYEDWYLVDSWSAVGVLEEAAISRGHLTAHDGIASKAGASAGAVYRLSEGHARPGDAGVSVWVSRSRGHEKPSLEALLGDGMDSATAGLWRRCLGLGPAPEYCLLASEPPAGVSEARLPAGWRAKVSEREILWNG
jgi:hypothetical protein